MEDLHTHTRYSPDSVSLPEENVRNAIQNEVKILGATDHIDLFSSPENPSSYQFDREVYFREWEDLRRKYERKLTILIGVEIGIGAKVCREMDELMAAYPWDYCIGSIHAIHEKDIAIYTEELNENIPIAYENYFQEMLYSVKNTKNFQILGHMDYIDRYVADPGDIPDYREYMDFIDSILIEIIRTDRGIEYNTAGLRRHLPYANPKDLILTRYLELGGKIITIGSDAHNPKYVGHLLAESMDHLKRLGFESLAYFRNQKIEFLPL